MTKLAACAHERRAVAARLSLLLVPVLILGASLVLPEGAAAAPPTPVLTGTTPTSSESSPASSTTPLIVGVGNESVITSVVSGRRFSGRSAIARAIEPSAYEIQLFNGAGCAGAPAKTGLVSTLESPGIQVTVNAGVATTFSALEFNPEEPGVPSKCSNTLTYWEGTPSVGGGSGGSEGSGSSGSGSSSGGVSPAVPASPPSPPHLHTSPGGVSNDTTPTVIGSAPGASSVKIFMTAGCIGSPVARGTAAQLGSGIPVQVPANAVSAFYGVSVGPTGLQSDCSSPAYYNEDSLAPHVRITMAPASKTRKRKAVIRFTDTTGNTPGTAFSCRVDAKKWRRCSSPLKLMRLHANHRYTVKIKATDPAGNVSVKPAKRSFKVI